MASNSLGLRIEDSSNIRIISYLLLYEVKVSVNVRIVGNVDGPRIRIIEEAESDGDVLGNDRQWGHFAAERDRQQDGVRAGVPHVDLDHCVTDARDIGRVNHLWFINFRT